MNGNCSIASEHYLAAEAYPCLEKNHSFGYAITGLINGEGQPVVLHVTDFEEPNIRIGYAAENLTGTVTCKKTSPGVKYAIYRFNKGNAGVPRHFNDYPRFADQTNYFVADSTSITWTDPTPILSSTTVAYRCVAFFTNDQFLNE